MVVAVTTKLEMTNLQSKAYTVIARAKARDKVKLKAASAITKACKIYLKIKKDERIPVSKIFDLNKTLIDFKKKRRWEIFSFNFVFKIGVIEISRLIMRLRIFSESLRI